MNTVLLVAALLMLLLLARIYSSHVRSSRAALIDRTMNQRILEQVRSLMGPASRMKENCDGHLPPEEREALRDTAIRNAIVSTSAIVGFDITDMFVFEDLEARVAAAVRACKIEWDMSDEVTLMRCMMEEIASAHGHDDDEGEEWRKG